MFKKRKIETPITQAQPASKHAQNTPAAHETPTETASPRKTASIFPSPQIKETSSMTRSPFGTPSQPTPSRAGHAPQAHDKTDRRTLVVGRGISVQGTVQDAERLVVEGTVEANMLQAKELHVTQGGFLRGEVEVEDAELAGEIDGTLTVRGNLIVRSTGRLIGKTRCKRLQVEDGGQISGHLEMITDNAAPAPEKPRTPSQEHSKSAVS